MKMFTLRLRPKTIFGIILIAAGIIVAAATFYSNHAASAPASVTLETDEQRCAYLSSLGWQTGEDYEEKQVTIPQEFNETYAEYNELQKKQGFDLEDYRGMTATVYTYNITNYAGFENRDCVFANLLVCGGELIGGDVCSTSVKDGFIEPLKKE